LILQFGLSNVKYRLILPELGAAYMICYRIVIVLACLISWQVNSWGQDFLTPSDTFSKARFLTAASAGAIIYGSTVVGLNQAWYKGFEKTSFHFFNDRGEWQHMDKMGHLFTTYFESEVSYRGLSWTGMKEKNATWFAAGLGLFFQTTVEMFDAYSARWGFSTYDMLYNLAGSTLFTSQQLIWKDQRIRLKVSSWPHSYDATPFRATNSDQQSSLAKRAEDLFGSNYFERYLKDYNAQTIWLSVNPKSFFSNSQIPNWVNVSVGYGSDNLFGGFGNNWTENGGDLYRLSPTQYPRIRQWYLAPDIDFRKIKTKSSLLKTMFNVLNIFKIPSPTLEYNSQGKFRWHWMFL
jgi:hypothetical protein